jgi:hypothetical protein
MPPSSKKWSLCDISNTCPEPTYLPSYIKNVSLFSGSTNNPGNLVTDSMRYTHKVTTPGSGHTTIIVPVQQRIIAPLSNSLP